MSLSVPLPNDGLTAGELFMNAGLSYDGFSILPGFYNFTVSDVDLTTPLTSKISLKSPFVSSPRDNLTESSMAVAMALWGGIGIIHHQCPPEFQANEVSKVKHFTHGFIKDLIVFEPNTPAYEVMDIMDQNDFCGIPITQDGRLRGKLLGLVTSQDMAKLETAGSTEEPTLGQVMTPVSKLVTAGCTVTLNEARRLMERSRKGKLPIVNERGEFMAIITRMDLKKSRVFPRATIDGNHQLVVGASISARPGNEQRLEMLAAAGVDVIILGSSQRNFSQQVEIIKYIKQNYPWLQVIGGNVVKSEQAKILIDAGADGLRVGTGTGSAFAGLDTMSVGRSEGASVFHVARYAKRFGIPIIADGNVRSAADVVKALTIGASSVMLGSLLAGTNESPGYEMLQLVDQAEEDDEVLQALHYYFRREFGYLMWTSSGERILAKGPAFGYLAHVENAVRVACQHIGASSLHSLHQMLYAGEIKFERRL